MTARPPALSWRDTNPDERHNLLLEAREDYMAERDEEVRRLRSALEHYRNECVRCDGTGVRRVKEGGRGNRTRFIETLCELCAPAREALRETDA